MEEFFTDYQHTFSALGTLFAVMLSLYLAPEKSKVKLKASMYLAKIFISNNNQVDLQDKPEYLVVSITNKGFLPIRIPFRFFSMTLPFDRIVGEFNPMNFYQKDPLIPTKTYPVIIAPNQNHQFYVSSSELFYNNVEEYISKKKLCNFFIRFLKFQILTEDGSIFDTNTSKHLRNKLDDLYKQKK